MIERVQCSVIVAFYSDEEEFHDAEEEVEEVAQDRFSGSARDAY